MRDEDPPTGNVSSHQHSATAAFKLAQGTQSLTLAQLAVQRYRREAQRPENDRQTVPYQGASELYTLKQKILQTALHRSLFL